MAKLLHALLRLQAVEKDLTQVRRRLKTRQAAVDLQQRKIDQLQHDFDSLHEKAVEKRKNADRIDLDIKSSDAHIAKLRAALNAAKNNKEYAAILTEMNTLKADNSKLEDEFLKVSQESDSLKADGGKIQQLIDQELQRLSEIERSSSDEIARLNRMMEELSARRDEAAKDIPAHAMAAFDVVSRTYEGEAMAMIEMHGKRPPFEYVCGGCFMSLNAEHANVLRVREEIRTCDNCRRILYMEHHVAQAQSTKAE